MRNTKNTVARSPWVSVIRHSRRRALGCVACSLVALTAACSDQCPVDVTGHCVVADIETVPVDSRGDAADDAVVLVGDSATWIAGTDKQFGLRIYDLTGTQLHTLDVGRLNNIDAVPLEQGFLVAATNRTSISIDLFRIDPDGDAVEAVGSVPLQMEDPYGLCMARIEGTTTIFAGDKLGRVERWVADDDFNVELLGELSFESQTEGCVVDAARRTLYVGEETAGIWAIDLDDAARELIDTVSDGRLVADVEGLDIYRGSDADYLVASSQGDNSFVVYSLPERQPILKFRIGSDPAREIDGVSDTDGVAVTGSELPGFPLGILVVQDGADKGAGLRNTQNFKIVDWRRIEALIDKM